MSQRSPPLLDRFEALCRGRRLRFILRGAKHGHPVLRFHGGDQVGVVVAFVGEHVFQLLAHGLRHPGQVLGQRPPIVAFGRQQLYRRRSASIEPVFGVLKNVLGFRRFRLFGQAKAQIEVTLLAIAYNLRQLARFTRRTNPQTV